jgi:predicted alpha/beta-fold hydrolase
VAGEQKYTFQPAWWIRGGHAQTLWGKFFRNRPALPIRRERWDTPDGDFVDVYRLDARTVSGRGAAPAVPRLVLFHGLEGTIRSHYVYGFFGEARRRGWAADLLIFRGCSDEPNRMPRFYHSGETTDPAFVIDRVRAENADAPLLLAGVSLGGNVLLKYLGERGGTLPAEIRAASAVSVPFDLERSCRHISRGFSKVYDRHFLRTLRRKAMAKLAAHPGLFDQSALAQARSIYDFDDAVTAPVHGFASAHDYYSRSSSLGFLGRIERPTLLLNAIDDPFLPPAVLDEVRAIAARNPYLTLEFTEHGGHVGFVGGRWPWDPRYYGERRVCEFLAAAL